MKTRKVDFGAIKLLSSRRTTDEELHDYHNLEYTRFREKYAERPNLARQCEIDVTMMIAEGAYHDYLVKHLSEEQMEYISTILPHLQEKPSS